MGRSSWRGKEMQEAQALGALRASSQLRASARALTPFQGGACSPPLGSAAVLSPEPSHLCSAPEAQARAQVSRLSRPTWL